MKSQYLIYFYQGDEVLLPFWGLFEMSASLFENYILVDFISKLFGVKKDRIYANIGFLIALLIIFFESLIINKFNTFEAFSIFIPIFTLFIYAYVFLKGNMFEKLFISLLLMTIIIVINSITALFISAITGIDFANLICKNDFYRFIAVIITKALFFVLTRLLLKFNNINKHCLFNKKEGLLILFSPIISIFFSAQMVKIYLDKQINNDTPLTLMLLFICILSANFTNYYLFLKINKNNLSELRLALLKQQYDYQTQNIEQVKNTYEEIRKMKHDLKNNIFCMMALFEQKNYDKATEYAMTLSQKVENLRFFADTDNEALNGIINLKLSLAQDKNIKLNYDIPREIIKVDDIDLCILTANLLDNAIEANQKIDKSNRYIEINIKNNGEYMIILIKNRIRESVLQNNPNLLTSKKNNQSHGIGKLSVKNIVEKYNGSVEYYEKDNLFCCRAVLKNFTA